ncbi:hypothetical protein AGMMS49546_34490 [Spirochaetia bacterium]|nr:hypothetical protein AGMMS49546_34490 [Spirochaetia bacterium]
MATIFDKLLHGLKNPKWAMDRAYAKYLKKYTTLIAIKKIQTYPNP